MGMKHFYFPNCHALSASATSLAQSNFSIFCNLMRTIFVFHFYRRSIDCCSRLGLPLDDILVSIYLEHFFSGWECILEGLCLVYKGFYSYCQNCYNPINISPSYCTKSRRYERLQHMNSLLDVHYLLSHICHLKYNNWCDLIFYFVVVCLLTFFAALLQTYYFVSTISIRPTVLLLFSSSLNH